MTHIVSPIGTVKWLRSQNDPRECVCCEGAHVFCRTTEEDWSTTTFVQNAMYRLPEGAKFRITVEIVD